MPVNIVDENERNITISYGQKLRPYHQVLTRLIGQHVTSQQADVLDYGCGVGHLSAALKSKHQDWRLSVADLDPRCLELTRQRVEVEREILLREPSDVYQIAGPFDLVIASHTLQYDPEPRRTLTWFAETLKPGGIVALATPNPLCPLKVLPALRRRFTSEKSLYMWDFTVLTNFVSSIEQLEVLEMTSDFLPLPFLNTRSLAEPLTIALGRMLPYFGFSVIAVLGKASRS